MLACVRRSTALLHCVKRLMSTEAERESTAVLEAALKYVPQYGWSRVSLREGARSVGVGEDLGAFPGGGGDLVSYFEQKNNSDLVKYMQERGTEKERVSRSKLIRDSLEHRLRMTIPYIGQWPQAMALKAYPNNALSSLEALALMVDDVWYWAGGDRSTDWNWYSKRGLLAAVYSATELYMIQDGSEDFSETWKFLDRMMEDSASFAQGSKRVQTLISDGAEVLAACVTMARNIAGVNSWDR